jgi:hypothetical protein
MWKLKIKMGIFCHNMLNPSWDASQKTKDMESPFIRQFQVSFFLLFSFAYPIARLKYNQSRAL